MRGNSHVQFLEAKAAVMPLTYSTLRCQEKSKYMKDITINPTYKKIRRRTLSLRKIDLTQFTNDEIINLLKKSFHFEIESFSQKPTNRPIYRARINEDEAHNYRYTPFDNKNQITYLENPSKYGRCNIIGSPVFYGADGLDVAACESCNGILSQEQPIMYLTIGEWILKNEIEVSIICHSKRAHKKSGDLIVAYRSLLSLKKKKATNKKEIKIWKIINSFLSNEFSKEVQSNEEAKYKISALFTSKLLKSPKVSGVYYPSVSYRFYGHNVALDIDLIDNGTLVLESVNHVKCPFVHKKKPPKIEILNSTQAFLGDSIIWH